MKESQSRANFIRLAEKRTIRLLKDIELLGNLSNRSNYSYTEDEVKSIFKAISKAITIAESRFQAGLKSRDNPKEFKLGQL
ncbi:hypothetical protein FV223_02770 [Methylobacterium sp. WL116]|nr:hypothetical protein FV223_02770 [Methylobacterium sp. WL116]